MGSVLGKLRAPRHNDTSSKPPDQDQQFHGVDMSQIRLTDVGVWRIAQLKTKTWHLLPGAQIWEDIVPNLPYFYRFLRELYVQEPFAFLVVSTLSLLNSFRPILGLYRSSQLLSEIQTIIISGNVDKTRLGRTIFVCLGSAVMSWVVGLIRETCEPVLKQRADLIFEDLYINAKLRLDVPTYSNEPLHSKMLRLHPRTRTGWECITTVKLTVEHYLELSSQALFIFYLVDRREVTRSFFVLSVARGLLDVFILDPEQQSWLAHVISAPWNRLQGLTAMATESEFHNNVVSNGLGSFIQHEIGTMRAMFSPRDVRSTPRLITPGHLTLLRALVFESPSILYALQAASSPQYASLASMAAMQQTSDFVQWTVISFFLGGSTIKEALFVIRDMYELVNIECQPRSGIALYPTSMEKPVDGMSLEFRNVSFSYPGAVRPALQNLSFTIKAGQVVVIVGENGSGKTSTISLLARLMQPSSGEIFMEGKPITGYRLQDICDATAMLPQEFSRYPLSLAENIGLGCPRHAQDQDQIRRAADLAGALGFIEKLPRQFEETVGNYSAQYHFGRGPFDGTELNEYLGALYRSDLALSGGQWQRIALARLFMRAVSPDVKLVCCDEPSNSLDPLYESDLFQRLRKVLCGKTRIFVTHRFGQLTQHADLILCLKDGRLVEQGTHFTLMAADGEYARMFNTQAAAFIQPSHSDSILRSADD